jgi:uridine kinase
MKPKIIGICGGSGSGKTTLAKLIREKLGDENCAVLYQDSYYIDQSHKFDHDGGSVNFDHPDALEFSLMARHIHELENGKSIEVPYYDFSTHTRRNEVYKMEPKPFIIVDGILIYSQPIVVEAIKTKIYVDTPEPTRFSRRLKRDIEERGREAEGVRNQYLNQVLPMHNKFVEPSKTCADIIVNGEEDFHQVIDDIILKINQS